MIPRISIIVPVYKVELYINRCIDSILKQTFTNFELILVDDGSPDRCGEICEEYAKKDKRIVVIHKENGGLSSARNAGLDIAKGDYIGFVDSDDYIHPQMYEILYKIITKDKSDMAISRFKKIYNSEENEEKYSLEYIISYELTNMQALEQLCGDNGVEFVVAWNKLYKKSVFDQLRYKNGKYHEDEYIVHELLYKCNKIIFIDLELYNYYQRDGSIMQSNNLKKTIDALESYENRMKFFKENKIYKFIDYVAWIYITVFFGNYNRTFSIDDSINNKIMKKSFRKNIIFFIKSSRFNIKEKISFIIFIFNENLYYKCIKKIKEGGI